MYVKKRGRSQAGVSRQFKRRGFIENFIGLLCSEAALGGVIKRNNSLNIPREASLLNFIRLSITLCSIARVA